MFFLLRWYKAILISFAALHRIRLLRLLVEDEGVKGCGWFRPKRHQRFHILGNLFRIIFQIALAPIYIFTPDVAVDYALETVKDSWLMDVATTPEAVLTTAPGGGAARYAVGSLRPVWMLKVSIKGGQYTKTQIRWTEDIWENRRYTALSYAFESACVLFNEADLPLQDPHPPEAPSYSKRDRQLIAERVLVEYAASRPDGVEYIWLDEFCLSDETDPDAVAVRAQRTAELGRLADIFRGSSTVCLFCHETECDHTGLQCPWGKRVFTLAEILHADKVSKLIRQKDGSTRLTMEEPGHAFRGHMQTTAALSGRWHLYAIMQHASNSGAVPWQVAIHALVVEVIHRDEAGGFAQHNYIGKALNGLLPRRSQLADLGGKDGWADLAWLLELNQGFYNAASLAAVCSLGDDTAPGHCWLGRPIQPGVGNERLEPLVTAFPVGLYEGDAYIPSALNILGPKVVKINHSLQRDDRGLYNNKDMRGLKWLSIILGVIILIIGAAVVSSSTAAGIAIIWIDAILYVALEMAVSTMYVVRDGWVFLYESKWGADPRDMLAEQDIHLQSLTDWGERQLSPSWRSPTRPAQPGFLLDVQHRVLVRAIVVSKPNALVPLAIHGSGVTCILLDRPDDIGKIAHKTGMASLPPYVLAQAVRSATICVGATDNDFTSTDDENSDVGDIDLEKQ